MHTKYDIRQCNVYSCLYMVYCIHGCVSVCVSLLPVFYCICFNALTLTILYVCFTFLSLVALHLFIVKQLR